MIGNYFTEFTSTTDYNLFVSGTGFTRPNVSWTINTDKVYYNPPLNPSIKICVMKNSVGYSVSQYDFDNHYDEIISQGYTVDGIVVVPQNHMKDDKARIMSLKSMNPTSPEIGSLSNIGIPYGGIQRTKYESGGTSGYTYVGVDTPLKNYTQVVKVTNVEDTTSVGSMNYCYLPSDKFSSDRQCITDKRTFYHPDIPTDRYAPSPYLLYDRKNSIYQTTAVNNALSDFDGSGNTNVLCAMATAQSDWRTASTIIVPLEVNNVLELRDYYPAACCCARYGTSGIPSGNWYLPACGELGYIIPRFNEINAAISLINKKAPNSAVSLGAAGYYWSSTEYSSTHARRVNTTNGGVYYDNKYNGGYVRAFASLPLSSLSF